MAKFFKIFHIAGGTTFFLLIVLLIGFISNASAQEEMPITTKSEQALKYFLEGRELQENLRRNEARELFSKAIEKDSDFALAYLYRGFAGISAMDYQNHLQKAVASVPKVSEGERLLIMSYQAFATNNRVEAVKLREQLVQRFPNDKRAHSFLAGAYGNREVDKAIAERKKAIEIDKSFAPPYNTLGYNYRNKGEYKKAEEAFKNYIRLLPDEANPHDSLADLYTRMGRHEDAIEHYKKALDLDPKFGSQRKIGTNLVFLGKYGEGREAYRDGMEMVLTPAGKVVDMQMIAYSYIYEGNYKQALKEYDKALKVAGDAGLPEMQAGTHSDKCRVFIEMGAFNKAEQSLAECKRVVMGSDLSATFKENFAKGALFDEASIAAKRKDFDKAFSKADEYKSKIEPGKNPWDTENHNALVGYIYLEKGDFAKAIEHLKQANQNNLYVVYRLAVSESKAGNNAKAAELFKKVANWNWVDTSGIDRMHSNNLDYALVRSKAQTAVKKEVAGKK